MNQNASSLSNTSLSSGTDVASTLTTVHLAWLVLLALIVIAGIVYGARLSARRKAAERQVREHIEEAGVRPTATAPEAAEAPAAGPPPADPAPSPATAEGARGGPVSQLKGLGPKVAARLAELGVTDVGQLAALDHDEAQALDAQLGPFRGRMERDRWIEQARFLAAGDVKGFEAVFGRL